MAGNEVHISVCICTFRRPEMLRQTLTRLEAQETGGFFRYSIVVADNDKDRSGEGVAAEFASRSKVPVTYCVEPEQNIALARNKAVEAATGNYIAFIDDDEFPVSTWLKNMLLTQTKYDSAGVLGPVKPHFDFQPPKWAEEGKFFERPSYPTGQIMPWPETRTGNVLLRKDILPAGEAPFRKEFGTGAEDVDFFRRLMERGFKFVWCDEAVVYEVVPPERCSRAYLLKRALLRGSNFPKHRTGRLKNGLKSLIAVPCYIVALPFLALRGQHVAFRYAIKICDHASRLLALAGWQVITTRREPA